MARLTRHSADGVLKDLETGLKQSTNYIQESHRRYDGPDGSQEWHEVRVELRRVDLDVWREDPVDDLPLGGGG